MQSELMKDVATAIAIFRREHAGICNLHLSAEYAAIPRDRSAGSRPHSAYRYRGEHCFICLNAFTYSSGHVMPYAHQSLTALEEAAALEVMKLARRTETALRAVYTPQGINLGMNLGQVAGAGVDEHLHCIFLPRWLGNTNFMRYGGDRILPETLDTT